MIERINAVQDRASAPVVKRRKIDTPEGDLASPAGPKKTMAAGGTGLLGAYVKEKRDEGQQTGSSMPTPTVDLTDGMQLGFLFIFIFLLFPSHFVYVLLTFFALLPA